MGMIVDLLNVVVVMPFFSVPFHCSRYLFINWSTRFPTDSVDAGIAFVRYLLHFEDDLICGLLYGLPLFVQLLFTVHSWSVQFVVKCGWRPIRLSSMLVGVFWLVYMIYYFIVPVIVEGFIVRGLRKICCWLPLSCDYRSCLELRWCRLFHYSDYQVGGDCIYSFWYRACSAMLPFCDDSVDACSPFYYLGTHLVEGWWYDCIVAVVVHIWFIVFYFAITVTSLHLIQFGTATRTVRWFGYARSRSLLEFVRSFDLHTLQWNGGELYSILFLYIPVRYHCWWKWWYTGVDYELFLFWRWPMGWRYGGRMLEVSSSSVLEAALEAGCCLQVWEASRSLDTGTCCSLLFSVRGSSPSWVPTFW
jgi:hypothetical protein